MTAVNAGGESSASAQASDLPLLQLAQWASTSTSNVPCYFNGIASDSSGNTYAVGTIAATGVVDFGNGVSVTGAVSGGTVIVKYNSAGMALWARTSTTNGGSSAAFSGISVDPTGNVLAAGWLAGAGTYGFGNNVTATRDSFFGPVLVKYDSSGTALWATTSTSSTTTSYWNGVATDTFGNVYCVGYSIVDGTESFGNGVSYSHTGNQYFPSIVEYNASGVAQAANVITTGTGFLQAFQSVAVSPAGDVCAVGYINGSNSSGTGRSFIVQFSSSLSAPLWTKLLDTPSTNNQLLGVSVDTLGQIYAVGGYSGSTEIDFGNSVKATGSSTGVNPMLIKLDSSGNTIWARTLTSGQGSDQFTGVALDSIGQPYVSGVTNGTGIHGFGNGIILNEPFSGNNPVVVKYNAAGDAQWAQSSFVAPGVTSGDNNNFFAITVDSLDHPLAAGYFQRTIGYSKTLVITGANGSNSPVVVRYNPY